MDLESNANITSWVADSQGLGIRIWIEPWQKPVNYHREFTSVSGSYSSKWRWIDGTKESGLTSHVKSELQEILNELVLSHGTLSLFCTRYGIEVEGLE